MFHGNNQQIQFKRLALIAGLILPGLLSLACGLGDLPLAVLATSTPTEVPKRLIEVEVTVVYVADRESSLSQPAQTPPPATAEILPLGGTVSPAVSPPPTDTPTFKPSPLPSPTFTSDPPPAAAPLPTPTLDPPLTATVGLTQTTPVAAQPAGPGVISLIEPPEGLSLPVNVGGLEFKWQWQGAGFECRLPEGYGFQVNIWPARDGYGPLGVMDVAKNQGEISCDPDSGIRSYKVPDLKGTKGVQETDVGNFLWNVAYVQLDPYEELVESPPRLFEISWTYTGPLDPFGSDLNCVDFPSWAEAQAVFLLAGGPGRDPHALDPDKNGTACDELR